MIKAHLRKIIFALLVGGLALFLYSRQREIEGRGLLRWYDRPVILVTAPVARGMTTLKDHVRSIFREYFYLVGVAKENERLRHEVEEARVREIGTREESLENERLRRVVDLRNGQRGEWTAARVISYPPTGPYRMITIDKGSEDGIDRRAPVISPDGLVGLVARMTKGYSEVLLITDPSSAVDSRIGEEKMGRPGARGLVVGRGIRLDLDRELFIGAFEYLSRRSEIEEGMPIVTSGLDGIYPAGILIGHVHGVKKEGAGLFQQAEAIPAVDFYKLREVLVKKRSLD